MGRTRRIRSKRRSLANHTISLGHDESFQQLLQWMILNGWTSTCKLTPSVFADTGRGLKALQQISSGDVLASIPGKLLMTVETCSRSMFGWLFKRKKFLSQQVLAGHLVFEKHLGKQSFWEKYIKSLPEEISTPVFTSNLEIKSLPEELSRKVVSFRENVTELYCDLLDSIESVETCPHCEVVISHLLTEEEFLWAWFIINSRAVYISPEQNNDHELILADANCLALAPYLDLFNHSNDAKVQAIVSEVDGSYQIRTLGSYKKYSEVFIHYGDHSNVKLYMEYGFLLAGNIHDTLPLEFDNVFSTVLAIHNDLNVAKSTYNFLKTHDLLTNIYLSSDGLSWSCKVLIYVLLSSEKLDPKTIQLKVYSNHFTDSEVSEIMAVGRVLVCQKKIEINKIIQKMVETKNEYLLDSVSSSYIMAINLYKEYFNVLLECERSIYE